MTGTKTLALLLLVAVPVLGACAGGPATGELPPPGADVRVTQFTGYEVNSSEGKWLGEVAGVLLNPETGETVYLVLFFREPGVYGRALMVRDPRRFIPIPWALFTPDPEGGTLSLDADEMTLMPAPYLKKAPASLSAAQAQVIDDYWRSVGGERDQPDFYSGPE